MIKVLAEMGSDPIQPDVLKQTPLFYACREGNTEAINFLISERKDNVNR